MLYYLYTVKLGMDEDGFFRSTLPRVTYLIERWTEEQKVKAAALSGKPIPEPPRTVRSLKGVLSQYGIQ
jgi:hypothetical protein